MRDALSFPMPVSERISFLYFERTNLDRDGHAFVALSENRSIQIPIGRTSVVLLGPGTRISHAGISLCALEGALLIWVGEAGVRLYSSGNPRSDGSALVRQCTLKSSETSRMAVARRIFKAMFSEDPPQRRSIEQLRGIEGVKVRAIYDDLASKWKLPWSGRLKDMNDPLNAAISTATSALYGVTEAAILALGYSPAVGFIHSGDARSFVFDIADTIKFKSVVPLAFELVATSSNSIEQRTRAACRDLFFRDQVISTLVSVIEDVLDANAAD